jgi:hypothetical protein
VAEVNREALLWEKIKDRVNAGHANWPSEGDSQLDVALAAVTERQLDGRLVLTTPWQVRDCILQREVCVCELVQPSKGDGGRTYISAVEDFSSLAGREGELRNRERSLQTVGRLSETSKRGPGPRSGKARRPQRGKLAAARAWSKSRVKMDKYNIGPAPVSEILALISSRWRK